MGSVTRENTIIFTINAIVALFGRSITFRASNAIFEKCRCSFGSSHGTSEMVICARLEDLLLGGDWEEEEVLRTIQYSGNRIHKYTGIM